MLFIKKWKWKMLFTLYYRYRIKDITEAEDILLGLQRSMTGHRFTPILTGVHELWLLYKWPNKIKTSNAISNTVRAQMLRGKQ